MLAARNNGSEAFFAPHLRVPYCALTTYFFHLFSFLTCARNFAEKQGTAHDVCDVVLVFVSPFFRFYFLELVSIRFIYIYKAIRLESGPRRTSFG